MQIDMHYYAVYTLARAAGLNQETARIIATSSQYVDDSTQVEIRAHTDGSRFVAEPTSHHPWQLTANNDPDDQVQIWVPFHFLPGGRGEGLTQCLVCRKGESDNDIVQEVVRNSLDKADKSYAAELIGVTAHVYADTFAHYGFSGVSSRRNRVVGESLVIVDGTPAIDAYLGKRVARFLDKYGKGIITNIRAFASRGAELLTGYGTDGALGHGAVAVYPDQPYLHWSYKYEFPELVSGDAEPDRSNRQDFLAACQALHAMFREFARRRDDLADHSGGRDFDSMEGGISENLAVVGDSTERTAAWQRSVADGRFFSGPETEIPGYDAQHWREAFDGLPDLRDSHLALEQPGYRFHQAAALYREFVLRDLLPSKGIVIV
jgi:hypothetical protein